MPLPHLSRNVKSTHRGLQTFFVSDTIREDLLNRTAECYRLPPPETHVPLEVHVYDNLCPLDEPAESHAPNKIFGYPSTCFRATSKKDGQPYMLRRIHDFRLEDEQAMSAVKAWQHITHPNIVSLREAFTTKQFGDNSLVFVYDFHPTAVTLLQKHFVQDHSVLRPESMLWSYIAQIAAALDTIHTNKLAARILEPSKILVTGTNRIRLNGVSILDLMTWTHETDRATHAPGAEPSANAQMIAQLQQEDLLHFGQLIVSLACGSLASLHHMQESLDLMVRQYSPALRHMCMYLLSRPSPTKSMDDVMALIGPRILTEVSELHLANDVMLQNLSAEVENGRLMRLITALGFINERPVLGMDSQWSETGDRYILKLFRDYVFHQCDDQGRPLLNFAHVLTCMNKLDAGIDEKIMLTSRDGQSCLVVAYREIKLCLEAALAELTSRIPN
ncbi:hypothetical protein CXG81DRAFT_29151 [Caulochytrium protostelioides]|uniref:PAN2-PAN3 deadenylation complex subunit PAN3 n=1 Tax=Caulochytrium protostelioides TaxID=1555241 RepID=A0A4P9XE49_9FUNG|nr:hypothetical protein CXG81DRAFT_29151 [Caulochytrium protostelioides]|eukprot:RKP03814.1 hypothetical protein CXG81DRAFT_29151 [Caulochytrium protostelioides]